MKLFARTLIFILLVFLSTGCDPIKENNNTNNINNTNNTNNINNINNINNTNNTNNNDPGICSVEDLPYQNECNPGYKCTITDLSNTVECINSGQITDYDICVPIDGPDHQDGCMIGSFCYKYSSDPPEANGICREFCFELYTMCGNGKMCSIELDLGNNNKAYLCEDVEECNYYYNEEWGYTATEGCGANEYCYMFQGTDEMVSCIDANKAGAKLRGESCIDSTDCAPGHTCFGPYGQETCHYICNPDPPPEQEYSECGVEDCIILSAEDPFGLCM